MYNFFLGIHSMNRYLVFFFLLWVIINSLIKIINKKKFNKNDNLLSLGLMIDTHIQLVIGLVLYGSSPLVDFSGMGMKIPMVRYWTTEHLLGMLIAIVLITMGRIRSKKFVKLEQDNKANIILFAYNTIAFIIIIATIMASDRRVF